jgi:hypothetical protein
MKREGRKDVDRMIKELRKLADKAGPSDFTSTEEDWALKKAVGTLSNLRKIFSDESPIWK